jgi:hypothetical protein
LTLFLQGSSELHCDEEETMRNVSTRATGLLILVFGIWGGLVPFVAPYFHFALGPDKSWTWTTGRLWLSVLPGAVALLGGLLLLGAGPRPAGKLGALLALAAGIWFAIGPQVSLLWKASGAEGAAHGSTGVRVLEVLTYHTLLGSVLAAVAGYALPGVVRRRTEATEEAEPTRTAGTAAPVASRVPPGSVERAARPAPLVGSTAADDDSSDTRAHRLEGEPATTVVGADPRPGRAGAPSGADVYAQAAEEPVSPSAEATDAHVGAGAARKTDDGKPAVVDGSTTSDAAGDDRIAPSATNGPAADDQRAPATTTQNTDSGNAPATEEPTSPAGSTPVTVRRRRGGLFSMLRG